MLTFGPPSLAAIARATLVKYKDFLKDVGWVPGELIIEVLGALSPGQLAHVEDCTLEGSGRDLAPVTWPCWLQHLTFTFGAPQPGAPLPPLPVTMEEPLAPPEPGVPVANYRAMYEQRQLELEKRREVSGKRLRQLWEQEASERQAKQIQIIDPLARKRPRASASAGGSPSSSSWRSASHSASQPAGARVRLMKKLGLGGKRGSSGGLPAMAPLRQTSQAASLRPGQHSAAQRGQQRQQQQQQQPGTRGSLHSSSSAGVQRVGIVGSHAAPFIVGGGPAAQRSHTAPAAVQLRRPPQQQQQQQRQRSPPSQHQGMGHQQPTTKQQAQLRQAAPPTAPVRHPPRPPTTQQQQGTTATAAAPAPAQQYRPQQRQPPQQKQQQVYDYGRQSIQSPMAEDLGDMLFLDEPLWLPPAAAAPHRPQPQQAGSRHGGKQLAAAGGAQPARQQASQRQAGPQAAPQPTHPSNCADLLDDVTWLPPAATEPKSSFQSLPGSPPAATKQQQQQQVTSRSPQEGRGAAGRPGSGAAGGRAHWGPLQTEGHGKAGVMGMAAAKKPELHLPAPRPRTVSAIKKAARLGAA